MVRTEGARSLYSGLVAGLQRQMSFASVRIGLYDSMKQVYTRGSDSTHRKHELALHGDIISVFFVWFVSVVNYASKSMPS